MSGTQQILGLRFHDGDVESVVGAFSRSGGVLVVPAAPALVRLQHDEIYRAAMLSADTAIPDSGLMVLVWALLGHKPLPRISGLLYLRQLLREPAFRGGSALFVLPSDGAQAKLLAWAKADALPFAPANCYVAPMYSREIADADLLRRLEERKPAHVVIAIGNGPQEKLGVYLRDRLSYRPAVHCLGAALGFLTGDQVAIPEWADRFYLGWLLRLFAQPRIFIPRLARAAAVPWLVFRYGRELPPLVKQRTENRGQRTETPH